MNSDLHAALAEITQRDLWFEYVQALCQICGVATWDAGHNFVREAVAVDDIGTLLRATPDQQYQAAMRALHQEETPT